MVNNIIRSNDNVYVVRRVLSSTTNEEDAVRIHHSLGTDTLLRDKEGKWFCCMNAIDVQFVDVDVVESASHEDFAHTGFEFGDQGGLG